MIMNERYPSYPLITHDPYFSIWSPADHPGTTDTVHWTGKPNHMFCHAFVDDKHLVLLGSNWGHPESVANLVSREVLPTRTIYTFEECGVRLTMTFLTPALLDDLDLVSRPLTYITFDSESIDGKEHDVKIIFSILAHCAVDNINQRVTWSSTRISGMDIHSCGSCDQDILNGSGDDLRIDWGYLCLVVPTREKMISYAGNTAEAVKRFISGDFDIQPTELVFQGKAYHRKYVPGLNCLAERKVVPGKTDTVRIMVAYNDIKSIEFLGRRLSGYWTLNCPSFVEMLKRADAEYDAIREKCIAFDTMLMTDAENYGGKEYAAILAPAYRQCIAAHKIVADIDGTPLFFSKENFSNGCICTVDVTYPSLPLFFMMQPALALGMVLPIMTYAESHLWQFPYAPHDLGTYPLANGQVYCMGPQHDDGRRMPVEECGNMLLIAATVAILNGNTELFTSHKATFKKWLEYLLQYGADPADQLCTDDFAGHLAHNANLAIKAILGIAAYGKLCGITGDKDNEKVYIEKAKEFAALWLKNADDGDHYRLAFDQPGSWSQKYNLVWDRLLDLNIFPASVAEKEMAYYKKVQNEFGLPLDSRKDYTKIDWILWTSILTDNKDDFRDLIKPVYHWLEKTVDRVPMGDWYQTNGNGEHFYFQARSVVGGLFIPLMADPELRKKYLARCK